MAWVMMALVWGVRKRGFLLSLSPISSRQPMMVENSGLPVSHPLLSQSSGLFSAGWRLCWLVFGWCCGRLGGC